MFTGIIENIGQITKIFSSNLSIRTDLNEINIGDSISINGVCLTITRINGNTVEFDYSPETINKTALKIYKTGDFVNLERSIKMGERFGGHFLTGHVEDVSKIISIKPAGNSHIYRFSMPNNLEKYIVNKGSIGIDGISLTIAEIKDNSFSVSIIPHTFNTTTLKFKKINDFVNIESDVLAKYIENLMNLNNKTKGIDENFLKENGFM